MKRINWFETFWCLYLMGSMIAFGHACNHITYTDPVATGVVRIAAAAGWPWYLFTILMKPEVPS